ncbi:Kelch domain-containing protein 3 [Geodia barretti]|uniref:Kelch domain-containing protein 3 n=1 Tax=Geodia barretti TaxID=519541 RepID=A0AA35SHE7_GEOBA|nr:Kelch domain-containing protein 3 [Geodia barretti]
MRRRRWRRARRTLALSQRTIRTETASPPSCGDEGFKGSCLTTKGKKNKRQETPMICTRATTESSSGVTTSTVASQTGLITQCVRSETRTGPPTSTRWVVTMPTRTRGRCCRPTPKAVRSSRVLLSTYTALTSRIKYGRSVRLLLSTSTLTPHPYQRASVPGCRYGHTVCQYKGKLYMYGGRNDEDGSFSDVDCYDTALNVWVKLHTSGNGPSSRDGHACSLLDNEMIVHGGFASKAIKFSGDMYAFNMDHHTWRKFPKRGERVPERDFHSATVVGDKVVVFGGRSDVFAPFFTANDIYPHEVFYYNLEISQWFKAPKKGPYRPDGRRSLVSVAVGDSVLYFGGYNATKKTHYGDLFMLNTITWECMEMRAFGDAPPPRRRVGCARIGTDVMICGGTSPKTVEKDGKRLDVLFDHSDMFILHLKLTYSANQ